MTIKNKNTALLKLPIKEKNTVLLNKTTYQDPNAYIEVKPKLAKPGELITITGKNFTAFLKRGNPGIPIMFDNKPLTGVKLKSNGTFKLEMKMPPFTTGKHVVSAFGVGVDVEVAEAEDIITSEQLRQILERDFVITDDCHLLLSDARYRVCPLDVLQCYLKKTNVPNKQYIAEWFDCDDFSDALHGQFTFDTYPKGYAHGELWVILGNGGGHAVNCYCVKDGDAIKMVVVEPQSGSIFDFPESWQAFMVKI